MNPILARTVLADVLRTATRLGATIPKPLASELAKLNAGADRLRAMKAEMRHDLGAAVLAALEADRDPFTDPDVSAAVVRRAVAESLHGVESAVAERTQAFVTDHAATILAAFADPFDTAAATIADAHRVLGDVPLADANAIGKRGGEAGRAWAEAQSAEKVIAEVLRVWKLLSQAAPHVPWFPQYRLLTIAEVPGEDWLEHRLSGAKVTPWDAKRNGWALSLATPEQYAQRINAVTDAQAAHDAAHADGFREQYRIARGMGTPAA